MVTGSLTCRLALGSLLALGSASNAIGVPEFHDLDRDGDGLLSAEEASAHHGLRELMAEYDRDHDGRLSRIEFERLIQDAAREARRITGTRSSR